MIAGAHARAVLDPHDAETDPQGFLRPVHPKLRPVETAMDGIFVAGTCQAPKDIPDTVAQASAAALVSWPARKKIAT